MLTVPTHRPRRRLVPETATAPWPVPENVALYDEPLHVLRTRLFLAVRQSMRTRWPDFRLVAALDYGAHVLRATGAVFGVEHNPPPTADWLPEAAHDAYRAAVLLQAFAHWAHRWYIEDPLVALRSRDLTARFCLALHPQHDDELFWRWATDVAGLTRLDERQLGTVLARVALHVRRHPLELVVLWHAAFLPQVPIITRALVHGQPLLASERVAQFGTPEPAPLEYRVGDYEAPAATVYRGDGAVFVPELLDDAPLRGEPQVVRAGDGAYPPTVHTRTAWSDVVRHRDPLTYLQRLARPAAAHGVLPLRLAPSDQRLPMQSASLWARFLQLPQAHPDAAWVPLVAEGSWHATHGALFEGALRAVCTATEPPVRAIVQVGYAFFAHESAALWFVLWALGQRAAQLLTAVQTEPAAFPWLPDIVLHSDAAPAPAAEPPRDETPTTRFYARVVRGWIPVQ